MFHFAVIRNSSLLLSLKYILLRSIISKHFNITCSGYNKIENRKDEEGKVDPHFITKKN